MKCPGGGINTVRGGQGRWRSMQNHYITLASWPRTLPNRGSVQGLFVRDENRGLGTGRPTVSRPVATKRQWAGRSRTIQEEMR